MITALQELESLSTLEDISKVVYMNSNNRKYEMAKVETFALLSEVSVENLIDGITFYGKGFKIVKSRDEYDNECFVLIDTKTPTRLKKIVPTTLSETFYDETLGTIPFKSQAILDEELTQKNKVIQETREVLEDKTHRLLEAKTKLSKQAPTKLAVGDVFRGGRYNSCYYVVIPYETDLTDSYYLPSGSYDYIPDVFKKQLDYVGYADDEGTYMRAGEIYTSQLEDNQVKELSQKLKEIHGSLIKESLETKKLVPIIGFSFDYRLEEFYGMTEEEIVDMFVKIVKSHKRRELE